MSKGVRTNHQHCVEFAFEWQTTDPQQIAGINMRIDNRAWYNVAADKKTVLEETALGCVSNFSSHPDYGRLVADIKSFCEAYDYAGCDKRALEFAAQHQQG